MAPMPRRTLKRSRLLAEERFGSPINLALQSPGADSSSASQRLGSVPKSAQAPEQGRALDKVKAAALRFPNSAFLTIARDCL